MPVTVFRQVDSLEKSRLEEVYGLTLPARPPPTPDMPDTILFEKIHIRNQIVKLFAKPVYIIIIFECVLRYVHVLVINYHSKKLILPKR